VTEEQIVGLKNSGADTVRIPVGDWMYKPYEPYIGCWDGSLEELDRVLRLCEKHGLSAIIDIHAMKGSQNGLDNSGDTADFFWMDPTHYRHWRVRGANWIGHYNQSTDKYDTYNRTHIDFSMSVVKEVIFHHMNDPVVVGLEPVNEPWEHTPLDILKSFYYKVNALVQEHVPRWMCLMHDSFRPTVENWASFFKLCDKCALDMHLYQAWFPPMSNNKFVELACTDGQKIHDLESAGVPVIVGEWSLATDNCAMWLNGLNDNLPGYPLVECARKPCPDPYMGFEQPGEYICGGM
jgi:glucan 1,3-beta-glucosidase